VEKRNIRISVITLAFSVMFLVVSSGAKAETQDGDKKDLVSVLHLEATSLFVPNGNSGERKDREINSLRTLSVPAKEGLHAFVDIYSPPQPDLASKDSRTDYRAVVGFHFRL